MNYLNSKLLSAGLIVLLIWLGISLADRVLERSVVIGELRSVQEKVKVTERDNQNIQKFLSNLQNSSFLEREARSKLNYKAPGEEVVFVYKGPAPQEASRSEEMLSGSSIYQKIVGYLSGLFRH